jgi:hypothetical protein
MRIVGKFWCFVGEREIDEQLGVEFWDAKERGGDIL